MYKLLRRYIYEALRLKAKTSMLNEPGAHGEEKQDEMISLSASTISGVTTSLGLGPTHSDEPDTVKKKKKKFDLTARAFGGGEYKD
jgi:hypothetical protein